MLKIFKSNHCGSIVEVINDGNEAPSCCGEPMRELKANTTDAAQEKQRSRSFSRRQPSKG